MTNLTYNDTIASFGLFLDTVSARCGELWWHSLGFFVHSPFLICAILTMVFLMLIMIDTIIMNRAWDRMDRMERDPDYARQVEEQTRKNCDRLFRP